MSKSEKNPYNKIESLASELKGIYLEIDRQREVWHNTTRHLVHKTFKSAVKKSGLHLHIRQNDSIRNLESIHLTFGILNSGLLFEAKKSKDQPPAMVLLKRGGLLAYSLMASGKVSVAIQFPYIEEIYGSPQNVKEIGIYSPDEITEEMILGHIQIFLGEIIQWEREEKKLIGFHLKSEQKK